jgi:uncharacterized protein (DUF362 family)
MTAPRSGQTGAAYRRSPAFSVVSPASTADPLEELKRIGKPEFADGGLRIAIKPNLTWIEPRAGVTTSREAIGLVASALISAGNEVVIVESNGGYGTFSADAAFDRHGLRELTSGMGARIMNLSAAETTKLKAGGVELDMPRTLLEDVDWIVNMPVPKVHIMTRYTGAVKNQWGLIPTDMRLRKHYRLGAILHDLLLALPRQVVVMDGSYFLDESGPIVGKPIKKDLLVFADHPLVADIVALRLMGWDLGRVGHLRAVANSLGMDERSIPDLPALPDAPFTLHRTFWNWVALAGFKSRALTYLGYESILAGPLHRLKTGSERGIDMIRSRGDGRR